MNFNTISAAISSAYNTSVTSVSSLAASASSTVVDAGKAVIASVTAGATLSLQVMGAVIAFVGNLVWWFVTLPINIIATIIAYAAVWIIAQQLKEAMEESEEARFMNATLVEDEAAKMA